MRNGQVLVSFQDIEKEAAVIESHSLRERLVGVLRIHLFPFLKTLPQIFPGIFIIEYIGHDTRLLLNDKNRTVITGLQLEIEKIVTER